MLWKLKFRRVAIAIVACARVVAVLLTILRLLKADFAT